jgi:hypothetical protein
MILIAQILRCGQQWVSDRITSQVSIEATDAAEHDLGGNREPAGV